MNTLLKLKAKFRAWLRIKLAIRFIRCERPDDIFVVERTGDLAEWQYTMEQIAQIVCSCGHPHSVVFTNAEFKSQDPTRDTP